MNSVIPGTIVFEGKSKKGRSIVIRYPTNSDLDSLLKFINELSKENTFVRVSGEIIDRDKEKKYIDTVLKGISSGNLVSLNSYVNGELAGGTSIERDTHGKARSKHVGIFGISLLNQYRGEGIGELLMEYCLVEAQKQIEGIKLIRLDVYEPNVVAQNLYKKFGFVEYGRLPKGVLYKGNYYDELSMYKEI